MVSILLWILVHFIGVLNKMYSSLKKHFIFLINSLLYTLSQYLLQYVFFGHNLEGLEKNKEIVEFITNSQRVIGFAFVCIALYFTKLIMSKKSSIIQLLCCVFIYSVIVLIIVLLIKISMIEYLVILGNFLILLIIFIISAKLKDLNRFMLE